MGQILTQALVGVDWPDLRRKAWHAGLMLASAWAAQDPRFQWAVPVLTGVAGSSAPPHYARPGAAVPGVLLAALVGGMVLGG